jgi:hypothetical protein
MHKLAINCHFLAVRTQVVAVVALLCVLFPAHHQLSAIGPPAGLAEQVDWLPYGANYLLVRLDTVVRAVVFHCHLKVCSQHPRVAHAASAAHVDRSGRVKRGQHTVLLLATAIRSGLLLDHALVERVVVRSILAALHHRYVWVTASHWVLTATNRVQTHILQLLLLLRKSLRLFKLLNFLNRGELKRKIRPKDLPQGLHLHYSRCCCYFGTRR